MSIKNKYLGDIMKMTCKFNQYPYGTYSDEIQNNIAKKYLKCRKKSRDNKVSIEEVLKYISEDEFLQGVSWFKNQLDFAMDILDEYGKNDIKNKRNVSSILEQL